MARARDLLLLEDKAHNVEWNQCRSPYVAKDYLNANGLGTGFYKEFEPNCWAASSNYKILDSSIMSNNIAYYVNGGKKCVSSLVLILNVNNVYYVAEAIDEFIKCSEKLLHEEFGISVSREFLDAIDERKQYELVLGTRRVSFAVNPWENGESLKLSINYNSLEQADEPITA